MTLSTDEIHDALSGVANIFLALAVLILSVHILAPLFGGKFLISALLVYGSWIVFALCMKYDAKSIKARKIGGYKFILVNMFELLCIFLWFLFPYNLAAGVLFSLLKIFGYKSLLKQIRS